MTKESPSIKVPIKIQRVMEAYERMEKLKHIFNRIRRVANQPMPSWKAKFIERAESEAFMKYIGAQGNWRKLWDKLNKKDIAKALEIKKEMEEGGVIRL